MKADADDDPFRPRFDWLLPHEESIATPAEVMRDLRGGLEDIPDTSATFKLHTNGARSVVDDHHANQVAPEMMTLVGSWEVPGYLVGTEQARRWVNPSYPHRRRFADVFVECECGALMVRPNRDRGEVSADAEHDHTDGCKRSWRVRARARLLEEREETIERLTSLDQSIRANHARFGVEPNSDRSLSAVSQVQNLDTGAIRDEAQEKRLNTEMALVAMGEDYDAVAACWGVTVSTIRERIATRSDWDLVELKEEDYEP